MCVRRHDRLWWAVLCAVALHARQAAGQDSAATAAGEGKHAVVVRNVNLRPSPATGSPRIRLLRPPDELELRGDSLVNGYLAVHTEDDEVGWVWARNVKVTEGAQPLAEFVAPAAAPAGVAASIDEAWDKPQPNHSSFTSEGKHCGATGDGGDTETNLRKNRTDVPASYHDVTFETIANLAYPVGPKHRHDWPAADLAEIERYEGVAVRVEGYLAALKPQTSGSGESTNCHWTHANQVDWHIALVGRVGQGEEESVVVETTPRIRRHHPNWTVPALRPWVDSSNPVRIAGWLMFDPEHRNHLQHYRGTLWEIHPITKIEVWDGNGWKDLDALP